MVTCHGLLCQFQSEMTLYCSFRCVCCHGHLCQFQSEMTLYCSFRCVCYCDAVTRTNSRLSSALRRVEELEQSNIELTAELQQLTQREAEHLEFSGRLTEKNSCLQADNLHLTTKVCATSNSQPSLDRMSE